MTTIDEPVLLLGFIAPEDEPNNWKTARWLNGGFNEGATIEEDPIDMLLALPDVYRRDVENAIDDEQRAEAQEQLALVENLAGQIRQELMVRTPTARMWAWINGTLPNNDERGDDDDE